MRKGWKLGLAICVPSVFATGLIAWGGYLDIQRVTQSVSDMERARAALRAFLDAVRENRIEEAYRGGAPELRCRMSLEQLRGLSDYYGRLQLGAGTRISRANWPRAHLADIEVSTHFDQDTPRHAALLKLDEGWRVAWIDRYSAALMQGMDPRCGERSMHIALVRQPLIDLLHGLERGDYEALAARFHPSRKQTATNTASQYAHLLPKAAALREVVRAEPAFDAVPESTRTGWKLAASLRAQGVRFSIRTELTLDDGWKLIRFDVDAVPAPN
jgi:hypothetical protein